MTTNFKKINEYVFELPRGGYILHKDDIYMQFGTPPETIKDTMLIPQSVPNIFVLPDKFFNWIKGISVAEMEFPIYFNFFLRKNKTKIVCNLSQKERFELLLKESIFGPKDFNISEDFSPYSNLPIPNIKAEMYFFGSHFSFEDMIEFYIFENNQCKLDNNITITKNQKFFSVYQNSDKISDVPVNIASKPSYDIGIASRYPFEPPLFGITCLGPSHGFDPTQNTSGFILWLNNSGIMIDPPVNSTEWLLDSNVNPKFIDSIILTHCHADHDAGTLQKILEEGKINVYTTKTVMYSFLSKYSSFTGVQQEYLLELFNFHRVFVGNPTFIHGGEFNFFYSLHSIPTVGFHLTFQNRTFIYSSDHNNDPEIHKKMLEQKVISQERHDELRNFPWETDIIYHEAGIAPLHTPIAVLNQLPIEVQKKITTYHISAKDFPPQGTTNLKLAKFGIEETKYLDCIPNANNETCNIIKVLKNLDFLDNISTEKVLEFIRIVDKKSYPKGTKIVRKGDIGDSFYVIQSGKVSVQTEGLKVQKIYSEYDYFGEVSVMTSAKRTADVVSETDVVAYIIEKKKFLSFIAGTEFENILRKLVQTRDTETWNLLSTSQSFYFLTSTQKTWLEALFETEDFDFDDTIIKQSELVDKFYIIRSGKVLVLKDNIKIATLEKGNFIGELYEIANELESSYSFVAESEVKLYYISKENILKFTKRNPGLIMKLKYEIQLNI